MGRVGAEAGRRIVSESATGERTVLLFPRLERVAPYLALPCVEIKWTARELESLAAKSCFRRRSATAQPMP